MKNEEVQERYQSLNKDHLQAIAEINLLIDEERHKE